LSAHPNKVTTCRAPAAFAQWLPDKISPKCPGEGLELLPRFAIRKTVTTETNNHEKYFSGDEQGHLAAYDTATGREVLACAACGAAKAKGTWP
jgi:hypothetical protein